ncbi:MAG: hypothetical protein J07HX5_01288 [halophilic archaeon J07HX5]|nr:MAG: hypothetical protein J07HX5_01288 [halophilic archaeon J07HX5]
MVRVPPAAGANLVGGVLGVDTELDSVSVELDVRLVVRELLAGCNPELPLDDIDPREKLRHRMLNLDPSIDLEKVEVGLGAELRGAALAVVFDEKLDGTGVGVIRLARSLAGGRVDLLTQLRRQCCGRALLDDLLVAALERAIALAEVENRSVGVGENLHLDVAWVLEIPFEVDGVVVEIRCALPLGTLELVGCVRWCLDDFHSAAAATALGFDRNRVAVLLSKRLDCCCVGHRLGRPRNNRHASLVQQRASACLLAERSHCVARRANPG